MAKSDTSPSLWLLNLRVLMKERGLNPRRLSLKAGLNPTAVRDMLEGRTRFPRYDTVQSLATALETTPARLMGEAPLRKKAETAHPSFEENLDLMVEIITRLQEVAQSEGCKVKPRDFAVMATIIYKRLQAEGETHKKSLTTLTPKIHDLLAYERMKRHAGHH